jgi:hypothetical protein
MQDFVLRALAVFLLGFDMMEMSADSKVAKAGALSGSGSEGLVEEEAEEVLLIGAGGWRESWSENDFEVCPLVTCKPLK